jgi:hypothetical protein
VRMQYAATLALGHSSLDICELMLSELSTFLEELTSEMESRPKWKVSIPCSSTDLLCVCFSLDSSTCRVS